MTKDNVRPLTVVALGGNSISPPRGASTFAAERAAVDRAAARMAALVAEGARLLIVHGNGPQVGRLLGTEGFGDAESLDVHVAQTQGELGYLLCEALELRCGEPFAALVTRVVVDAKDAAFRTPTKPVGAVLTSPPAGVASAPTPDGSGFRRVVASPRPLHVVETGAVRALLSTHHVIAGGGGGVALVARNGSRNPQPAVVDKDWVAALLAIEFDARALVFVTDVPFAFDDFATLAKRPIRSMSVVEARRRLHAGAFAPGSMAPKVESAVAFVEATRRSAVITTTDELAAARRGNAGTTVTP